MLLAHNINDVDLGIRRLCQTKLYMKQAPDSAYLAARELIFPGIETERIVEKLKLLDSHVGALTFVTRKGNEKVQEESVFIKTEAFQQPLDTFLTKNDSNPKNLVTTELNIIFGEGFDGSKSRIEFRFLDESTHELIPTKDSYKIDLILERKYLVYLINEKGRIVAETAIIGKPNLNIFLDKNKLLEIT